MTDLSEESAFEAGRYAFAVWSCLVAVKRLSSFRPESQERLGGAKAAGLLGCFRSTHLRGRWRGKDWPRAPQTVVGGGCAAWVPLLSEGSFLGSDCSLDKEEERVEWSLVLLGMNCLRAADCVLAERNFSTTELTASPNNPDCEMGASSKNTFSFSRISVRFSHKWRSAATEPAIERPHSACGVLSGSESQVSGSAQLFHSLWTQTSPLVHLFKHVHLVGLKDGHRVEGHACLTGRDVGLPDKGGSGPTWLGRKEGAGLPGRRQRG